MLWSDGKEVPSSLNCYMHNRFVNSDGGCHCIPCTVHDPIISILWNAKANKQQGSKMLQHNAEYMNNFVEVNRSTLIPWMIITAALEDDWKMPLLFLPSLCPVFIHKQSCLILDTKVSFSLVYCHQPYSFVQVIWMKHLNSEPEVFFWKKEKLF